MFIDLRKTPEGSSSAKTVLSFTEEYCELGRLNAEFPATVSIKRYGATLHVDVDYECVVECDCARCCKTFVQSVAGGVSFEIRSVKDGDGSGDVDEYFYESEDDRVDFTQTVYDDCMVRVPVKPLCSETCTGFEYEAEECCGDTPGSGADSRWDQLKKLKNK